jgi:acyl-CoA thioester hydrolase
MPDPVPVAGSARPVPPPCSLRVRFDEVDTMGIVHHPRYLVYLEIARTEWFRAAGVPYVEVIRSGTHLAVTEVGIRYLRPARYDDEILVRVRLTELGGARLRLDYEIRRGDDLLATAFTRLGAVDTGGRAKRLPEDLRARFAACVEDGPPPVV